MRRGSGDFDPKSKERCVSLKFTYDENYPDFHLFRLVSYDVNKDGVKVAVLTFIKSAFRLGETIQGVVELNQRTGRGRVVQVGASYTIPHSLSNKTT